MSKLYTIENKQQMEPDFYFHCPGCECDHGVWTTPGSHPVWGFNGNIENPTFTPSIKVTYPVKGFDHICHSFVANGRIQYLNDCTHHLAGQTIDLPEITKLCHK